MKPRKPEKPVVEIKITPAAEVLKKSARKWMQDAIDAQLAKEPTIDGVAIEQIRIRKVDTD
jgi:hypothetical protein